MLCHAPVQIASSSASFSFQESVCTLETPERCVYLRWPLAAWLQVVPSGRSDVGLSECGSEMVQKENVSECLIGLCVF